jgi:peptidoglycan hydrolase-like protein with peptidoglycan-binding domain
VRRAHLKVWLVVSLTALLLTGVAGGSVMALDQRAPSPAIARSTVTGPPISVVAVTPAPGSKAVVANSIVAVRFSGPVDATEGFPTLSPPVDGTWSQPAGDLLVFLPSHPLAPFSTESVSVTSGRSGSAGVRAADGAGLTSTYSSHWQVAGGSTLRLQQLLAGLGYLPLTFTPAAPVRSDPVSQDEAAFTPPSGSFSWQWPATPPALVAEWQPGAYNAMTQGAVMAFEADHGLGADGQAGPLVWSALLGAAADPTPNQSGYSFVQVTKTVPQHLTIWHDGRAPLTTAVNTGVSGDITPDGSWPVFARYASTTMRGVNPDGSRYDDPGVPFVNYFHGGDAVHGFTRAQYGYPQSDGCVELPLGAARTAYGLLEIGSLVEVGS